MDAQEQRRLLELAAKAGFNDLTSNEDFLDKSKK